MPPRTDDTASPLESMSDAVAVRIGFEPSGQLSGLRMLPPPFAAAGR